MYAVPDAGFAKYGERSSALTEGIIECLAGPIQWYVIRLRRITRLCSAQPSSGRFG